MSQSRNELVQPADIPALCLPIVEKVEEIRPDIIVAYDTGARLAAYALDVLLRRQRLDTQADKIQHLSISSTGAISFRRMVQQARETLSIGPATQRVFALDDVTYTGNSLITGETVLKEAFPHLENASVFNGVLIDVPSVRKQGRAVIDVSGMEVPDLQRATASWSNRPDVLGVRRDPCRSTCQLVESPQADQARRDIDEAVNALGISERLAV